MKRWAALLTVIVVGALLLWAEGDMPAFGDPDAPAHAHVAPRYIEEGAEETGTTNLVSAILADFRSFDTLGEITVIFTAGVSVILLLRRGERL